MRFCKVQTNCLHKNDGERGRRPGVRVSGCRDVKVSECQERETNNIPRKLTSEGFASVYTSKVYIYFLFLVPFAVSLCQMWFLFPTFRRNSELSSLNPVQ